MSGAATEAENVEGRRCGYIVVPDWQELPLIRDAALAPKLGTGLHLPLLQELILRLDSPISRGQPHEIQYLIRVGFSSMSSPHDGKGSGQMAPPQSEKGPYILRSILTAEQLAQAGLKAGSFVTCVEFWDNHLYIGTSEGEVLHYMQVPSEDGQTTFVYAFTLPATYAENAEINQREPGVKQILLLPSRSVACVLCNGTISFYSLPELSPIFTKTTLHNCTWVGGCDLNLMDADPGDSESPVTIMISQKSRLRLITIGERPQLASQVELGSCLATVRRGEIACIADAASYSLLHVANLERIPLAEISSVAAEDEASDPGEKSENVPSSESSRPTSQAPSGQASSDRSGHGRSSSMATIESTMEQERRSSSSRRSASEQLDPNSGDFPPRGSSLSAQASPSRSPAPRGRETTPQLQQSQTQAVPLKSATPSSKLRPHIVSPTANEFMFTTGTTADERGVGMFVNMEGDPCRGTLEFSRYPISICVEGKGIDTSSAAGLEEVPEAGYILALVDSPIAEQKSSRTLEIQRWDIDSGDPGNQLRRLTIPDQTQNNDGLDSQYPLAINGGLRYPASDCQVEVPEIVDILGPSQLDLPTTEADKSSAEDSESNLQGARDRALAEKKFIGRLSVSTAQLLLWSANNIWWILRNPEIMDLDASLREAADTTRVMSNEWINRNLTERTLNEIRGREPSTELEAFSLREVRQKGSLILFIDTLHQTMLKIMTYERDRRVTEETLTEGEVDPRIILSLIPLFSKEVIQGTSGIWASNGIRQLVEGFLTNHDLTSRIEPYDSSGAELLHLVKRYLLYWRRKKGNPSITDEREVFRSVDAAVLHILLVLDTKSPRGAARKDSVRSELNAVVDNGLDCFDRAVSLLESFKRLYVLSRLYQSRKMAGHVLRTWQRIMEGEEDQGGEFVDGEIGVRQYLTRINDAKLVEEYGTWLARRNPKLGVQVFSDRNSKVKFTPERSVEILKEGAPSAVKDFLEHLVFDHNLAAYADDLIGYYVNSVVSELESSEEARSILAKSYETYQELHAPKPTYSKFAADLHVEGNWWQNRLRLLQLLGGSHGAASKYDVEGMLSRIKPHEQHLVPEMIVLNGRQGKHREAIRLLTHGLGDFDTAIRYCVLGGSSTYSPLTGSLPSEFEPSRSQQEELFAQLVEEFLQIKNIRDRLTQTSELLERFSGWFNAEKVLALIPDDWSVELVSSFLQNAFRTLVTERHEAMMTSALAGTDNLNTNFELIEKAEWRKPQVDNVST